MHPRESSRLPAGRGARRRRLLAALLTMGLPFAGVAQPPTSREAELKSAFIYRFTQFVEWPGGSPAAASPSVVLCVLGDDALASALERAVEGKTLGERRYTVRRPAVGEGLEGCAVVYVPEQRRSDYRAALSGLRTAPVLTIGDAEDFTQTGGIIRLYREEGRLRFEINPDAVAASGLKLSSQLLRLARLVRSGSRRKP